MKKIVLLLFLIATSGILLLLMQACKKESNEVENAITKDNNFVAMEEANVVASNINKSYIITSNEKYLRFASQRYTGKRHIHDTLTIADKKMPYLYVFNYESGGYTIISADRRLLPVMAYVDSGNFSLNQLPYGLVRWLETNAQIIKDLRKSNAAQSALAAQEWDAMSCPVEPAERGTTSSCTPSVLYSHTVGPLLKTAWNQDCGYNTYCPTLSGGQCGHAYTGCSTTAVAQVMAYWKYPTSYSWDAMPLSYGNDAVAHLMGDIFPNVITSYDASGSSCSNDYNIRHALLNNFGYSSASLAGWVNGWTENGGYDYQKVKASLDLNEPVILGGYSSSKSILGISYPSGSGHTWVCDGYQSTEYTTYGVLLFSMNWGWGGKYNGWYAYNNWANPNGNYSYFTDMIFNIHP